MIRRNSLLMLLFAVMTASVQAAGFQKEANPVWRSLKYGIYLHNAWGGEAYPLTKHPDLSVPKTIDEMADPFDVEQFIKDIQSFNPEYVVFTAWHAEMNPVFPCKAMDQWRGKGHSAKRDLMGEIIEALRPTGIKFVMYLHPSDGHDMTEADQELLGWNESIDQSKHWGPGRYVKWNNFMNDVFDEVCSKYGKDIVAFWIDGGWQRVDRDRLKKTAWKYNPKAEFVSGWDNAGWCHQFNQACPPDAANGIPASIPWDADTWPSLRDNANLLQGGCWWTTGGTAKVSPVGMLRYTVLHVSGNTGGGGVGWAAGNYTDGSWEPQVKQYLTMLGDLMKPIEESIKNTRPSTSYVTGQGTRIASLPNGCVATSSADNAYEYIHVLVPPIDENFRYQHFIELPAPQDYKKFTSAVMLRTGRQAKVTQTDKGVRIDIPWLDAWDPVDTVIKLTVQPGFGLKSTNKPVSMSAEEVKGWGLARAVDGDSTTGWSSEMALNHKPWFTIDLQDYVSMERVHLFARVFENKVGHCFPQDFTFSVSNDGKQFRDVLSVKDYTINVADDVAKDDKLLNGVISRSGSHLSSDFPQYFNLPKGTAGRYLRITGDKLKDEMRMQFTEVQLFGETLGTKAPGAQAPADRKVIPAKAGGKIVSSEVMDDIYKKIKTPYKYGVVLQGENGRLVDRPSVFRYGDKWYMMYITFDGAGYETLIAVSDDLLDWKPLGKALPFQKDTWDAVQSAGYIALQDHTWGGSYELGKHDGKYWMSYLGGNLKGYEADPLKVGIAYTDDPSLPQPWTRLPDPVLTRDQPDCRYWEEVTQYKSNIIHDKEKSLGYPCVMFYNAKTKAPHERIGMAVSDDMKTWHRYGVDPVVDNPPGISGDPQITKIDDVWVMFFFGAFWIPGAFDTFACSYDLVNWTQWEGPLLVESSEPWDETFAHKPWVIKHEGVVYHFYCAVGDQGRVIALSTSKDLKKK